MTDRYRVEAHRSGKWWALEFPDSEPWMRSQCRRLDQAAEVAASAYLDGLDLEVSPDQIDVIPIVDGIEVLEGLVEAAGMREEAAVVNERAQAALRAAAAKASAEGFTVRDIGVLLGVTSAYAARLVNEG